MTKNLIYLHARLPVYNYTLTQQSGAVLNLSRKFGGPKLVQMTWNLDIWNVLDLYYILVSSDFAKLTVVTQTRLCQQQQILKNSHCSSDLWCLWTTMVKFHVKQTKFAMWIDRLFVFRHRQRILRVRAANWSKLTGIKIWWSLSH